MEYIELLDEDLKSVKYAEKVIHKKYLEDDYGILSEDLLDAFNEMVEKYKHLLDDYNNLRTEQPKEEWELYE